jgi:hypothetical protein
MNFFNNVLVFKPPEMFGEKISQQDDYNYLGLLLNYNGNFYKARKKTG